MALETEHLTTHLSTSPTLCTTSFCHVTESTHSITNVFQTNSISHSLTNSLGLSLEALHNPAVIAQSNLLFLWIFLAGMFSCFTPCVYPMIPLVLRNLLKTQKSSQLLLYFLGMVCTYMTLGIFAITTHSIIGFQFQSPIFTYTLSGLLLLFGISMWVNLPIFDKIQSASFALENTLLAKSRSEYWRSFIMGIVSGAMAGPCTGPVLASILIFVSNQNLFVVGASMFAFSAGFFVPFLIGGAVVLGLQKRKQQSHFTNPNTKNTNKQRNSYLKYIIATMPKHLLGSCLIALGIWYSHATLQQISGLKFLFEANTFNFYMISLFTFLCISVFNYKIQSLNIYKSIKVFIATVYTTILLLFSWHGVLYIEHGFYQKSVAQVSWENATAVAVATHKKIFVDLQADWCQACQELKPDIESLFANKKFQDAYVPVAFNITHTDDKMDAWLNKYQIEGLPTIVILDEHGKLLDKKASLPPIQHWLETFYH
jgi:thioredoxin:protein disulfide reductase